MSKHILPFLFQPLSNAHTTPPHTPCVYTRKEGDTRPCHSAQWSMQPLAEGQCFRLSAVRMGDFNHLELGSAEPPESLLPERFGISAWRDTGGVSVLADL